MRTRLATVLTAAVIASIIATGVLVDRLADIEAQHDDLDLFLTATANGWVEASNEFFRSPVAAAALVQADIERSGTPDLDRLIDAIGIDDDIDAAFVGYPDGSFHFAARADDDGFRTRTIEPTGAGTVTELRWLDAAGSLLRSATEIDDGYDPRARPWYLPIAAGATQAWSDPYTFSSSGQPGITHSLAVTEAGSDDLVAVVGIDVRLTALDRFLENLRPGPNGEARLYASPSVLVAATDAPDTNDGIDPIAPIGAPIDGSAVVRDLGDDHTMVQRTFGTANEWTLVAVAADADFVDADGFGALAVRWFSTAVPAFLLAIFLLRRVMAWFRSLYHDATRDELTELANRTAITAHLRKALDSSKLVSAAIVDLDGFKPVNDTWGHECGDAALRGAAQRLSELAERRGLRVGRLGGDEFLVVGIGRPAAESDGAWPEMVTAMARPFDVDGIVVRLGASVGVAHIDGADPDRTIESALRRADRALYAVKRNGGSGWQRSDRIAGSSEVWTTDPGLLQLDLRGTRDTLS